GNRTKFIISFNTTLPDGGIDRANEYGWDHNKTRIFKFSNSYPQPCVYDEYDGWNIDPYLLVGDPFYFDMAYYDFIINVPVNMTVAATGELLDNTTIGDRTIYHYNPKLPVREVTFSASRYFAVQSVFAEGANVTVSAYYLNKSAWLWENFALNVLGNSGSLYYSAFGNYTYPTLNVVQEYTYYGGMEYPCQVYVSEAADHYYNPWLYLENVIAHEIAHQWFYNLVGFDEVDWGFLDEGIVCWVTDWYKEVFHPDWQIFDPYWILTDYVWHYSLNFGLPNKINQSIPDCLDSGTDYWYTAYRKTPVVLENFRRIMGLENLIYGIRLFTHEHFFDIATLEDFQQALETTAGVSLDWFFLPWFNNPYLPKYNFTSVIYDAQSKLINITIEDVNEILNPYSYSQTIPIEIYSSGSTLEFSGSNWINSTTSVIIPIQNKPVRVVLNYSENIPVQFTEYGLNYLETTDIITVNEINSINVTTPSTSSSWEIGLTYSINWTSIGSITNVNIELFRDGTYELEIVSNTPNDGDFIWIIPSGLDDSINYQIKITDASNSSIYDFSEFFEIYTTLPTEQPIISGYNVLIIIATFSFLGIIIISKKRRKY
ncbi:MAG: M1 family aminopeptidase, partial [Candidatus Hodarchaeota archaeon]